ncbi:MAG: rseP [Bacillales bacterium]|jgi:regulator of sigma E protease|nr:rseP [Bacillales bacterium]
MQLQTILSFVLMFGALVIFHEFGHLYFAKRAGILCREFAIGMGPKILSWKRNETMYTIRLFPIGGYVRMSGEDPEMLDIKPGQIVGYILNEKELVTKIILKHFEKYPNIQTIEVEEIDLEHRLIIRGTSGSDEVVTLNVDQKAFIIDGKIETQIAPFNRQFHSKSVGQRALAIFAGPMMNFVLAIILFAIIASVQGVLSNESKVGDVSKGGIAESAGLQKGDKIISIDGTPVETWEELVINIQKHPGEEVEMVISEAPNYSEETSLSITPEVAKAGDTRVGRIGIFAPTTHAPLKVISYAFTETYRSTKFILESVKMLVTGSVSVKELSGPVGIYAATEEVVKNGFTMLLRWSALLSINLGIMNLLPLPALDGGRLLFFAYEAVRGKPIDRNKESLVHLIGFSLLMLLMLIVTWNDIQRFFF